MVKEGYIVRKFLSIIMILISVVSFCLNGCATISEDLTGESTIENTIKETGGSEGTVSKDDDTDLLIPYDSEKQIYFSCYNWDTDIYLGSSFSPQQSFEIVSLSPIDIEDIHISIPIESDYAVKIEEITKIHTTDYLNSIEESGYRGGGYPYYLYQCARGTDWKKMKELYDAAQKAEERLDELMYASRKDPEYLEQKAIVEEFYDYRDLYLEDYQALTAEDLPTFYEYRVNIWFGASVMPPWEEGVEVFHNKVTESFQIIEIEIDGQFYTQNIGEVRLYTEGIPRGEDYVEEIGNIALVSTGMESFPWGDGRHLECFWKFRTKKDITVTGMSFYEEKAEINLIGAHVILTGKTTFDFYWDLKTPFEVESGTDIRIELLLEDIQFKQLEYSARVIPVMKYEVSNKENIVCMECILDRISNFESWLRYAIVFEDWNVQSYFEDYYRPIYESWREEIPW